MTATSDVVAHLVLAHQTQMHNLITQTNYQTRLALYKEGGKLSDAARLQFERPAEQLVRYLLFTNEAQHPSAAGNPPAPGVPSPEELIAVYVETRGEPLPDFAWFEALIRFKEASASALLTKRAIKAGIDDPDRLVTPVLKLIEQTIEQLEPWVKP